MKLIKIWAVILWFLLSASLFARPTAIPRNQAWNDIAKQFNQLTDNLNTVRAFLKEHEYEPKASVIDIRVFKALEEGQFASTNLHRDLEIIQRELAHEEVSRK
jgi:hypothetical protein